MQDVESHRANSPVLFTDLWVDEERDDRMKTHTHTHYVNPQFTLMMEYFPDRESSTQVFILYPVPHWYVVENKTSEITIVKTDKWQYTQEIL